MFEAILGKKVILCRNNFHIGYHVNDNICIVIITYENEKNGTAKAKRN